MLDVSRSALAIRFMFSLVFSVVAILSQPCFAQQEFVGLSVPNFAQMLHRTAHGDGTIRLPSRSAKVTGYQALMNRDFYGGGKPGEALEWRIPVAGRYHVALAMYDSSAGVERLDVAVGNRRVGTIAAAEPRTGRVLFVSPEPVDLRKGDIIRIASAAGSAPITFGDVSLMASMPEVPALVIENLVASHRHGDSEETILVAWTTNRPADGLVQVGEHLLHEGRGRVNNHQVFLPRTWLDDAAQLEVSSTEEYRHQTAAAELAVHRDPVEHFLAQGGSLPSERITDVELHVAESTSEGREAWPVSSGVPLPIGVLVDTSRCRLRDANGNEVPAQFRPLAWHPDGVHVKWLLVDFFADTTAGEAARYTLRCGEKSVVEIAKAPAPVDIGPSAEGFAPFANVTFGDRMFTAADVRRCGFELTDGEGRIYSSATTPPDEFVVEETGPVRTTVRVRGRLADDEGRSYMRYLCRLRFYAGRPAVQVAFTLENDVAEPEMNLLQSLRVRIPVAAKAVAVGADGQAATFAAGQRLLQDEDHRFVVKSGDHGNAGRIAGQRADGWLLVPEKVAVQVRDFWQRYPKGFTVEDDAIVLDLLPSLAADQYAGASDDDLTKLYYWCDRGQYKIRTGVRLTTEFVVDFDPAERDGRYADAEHWQQPLFAACTPKWYCDSGAFGSMVPRQPGKFDVYERNLDNAFAEFMARRESVREYGFMNLGDWFGERKHNWGNIEYDTPWALAANFARTGNLDMLRRAIEAESHNADVDTKHYGRGAGEVWAHATGHTGGYFPRHWKKMTLFNEGVSGTGHTWCQGLFVLYGLTGERRFLETGRKIADRLAKGTTDFEYYAERNIGWPIVGLMGAHGVTGNPFHLNGAKLMADSAIWTQSPETGGWGHWIDTNECRHASRCWGCKTFMTGVLLHGLKMYDLAQPREDVRDTIRKNCDFIWRTCYLPRDRGFVYSECFSRRDKGRPGTFSIVGDGLAYGCRLDPQQRHRESLRHAANGYFYYNRIGAFGKQFTNATCFMPLMLGDLEALGLTEFPNSGPVDVATEGWLRGQETRLKK